MLDNAITAITKKDVMNIGSQDWREVIIDKTTNTASGFRAAGLWYFYFTSMKRRLKFFKDGCITHS